MLLVLQQNGPLLHPSHGGTPMPPPFKASEPDEESRTGETEQLPQQEQQEFLSSDRAK
jgi:hypothetical protein